MKRLNLAHVGLVAAFFLSPLVGLAAESERDQMHHSSRDSMTDARSSLVPHERMGSGTSWLPDETPMHAFHFTNDQWKFTLHGNLFLQYINEGGRRGDDQFGSINWLMAMAERPLGNGNFAARTMLSLERWTVTKCGYPDLLATGEVCNGEPIHDRQHPHDLFMELAASYTHPLSSDLNFEIYGGPVGEPALGPVAFPHRPSAFPGPLAPITHHWLDATHIAFGVATVGVFGRRWKAEASAFNGREPGDTRTKIDLAPMDSFAGRFSYLPNKSLVFQVSGGHINEAEAPEAPGAARIDVTRYTGSMIHHLRQSETRYWTNTFAIGHNVEEGHGTSALLLESSFDLEGGNILSGRAEWVEKSGHDLALDTASLDESKFSVAKVSAGYTKEFSIPGGWRSGIGGGVSMSFVPSSLEPFYGERTPLGFVVFASLRPDAMAPMKPMNH